MMIVVNLRKSYREVLSGVRDMEDATLGWWADVNDDAIARYGDVVVGVYNDQVVSVYDVTGHERREDGRVFFEAEESVEFASLLLLVAAVGAVVLARRRSGLEDPREKIRPLDIAAGPVQGVCGAAQHQTSSTQVALSACCTVTARLPWRACRFCRFLANSRTR